MNPGVSATLQLSFQLYLECSSFLDASNFCLNSLTSKFNVQLFYLLSTSSISVCICFTSVISLSRPYVIFSEGALDFTTVSINLIYVVWTSFSNRIPINCSVKFSYCHLCCPTGDRPPFKEMMQLLVKADGWNTL